jgi:hypothetical protein
MSYSVGLLSLYIVYVSIPASGVFDIKGRFKQKYPCTTYHNIVLYGYLCIH